MQIENFGSTAMSLNKGPVANAKSTPGPFCKGALRVPAAMDGCPRSINTILEPRGMGKDAFTGRGFGRNIHAIPD